MNKVMNEAFWKAVAETAAVHGIIEASVVVYCRVLGKTVNECTSLVGLGSKHIKDVLEEFDRYSATVVPVSVTEKMSA